MKVKHVMSGVPLGSNCTVDLFADNSFLHKQIKSTNDCKHFQGESVSNSCDTSMIQLKEGNCRLLHVTRQK